MEVLDAWVAWEEMETRQLRVVVDEVPDRSELRFEQNQERGLWYGEKDGYVEFFAWSGPENEGGYGGRHFEITTVDGETQTLKGPWSSRTSVMNQVGFGPCLSVKLATANPEAGPPYDPPRFATSAVSLEIGKQAVDQAETASHLERDFEILGEPLWVPRRSNGGS